MGQLSKAKLAAASLGVTVGISISLVGVFTLSTAAGLILTGLTVTAAALFGVRLDRSTK